MEVPCEMLLHPELLTNDQLMYILQERQLRVPSLDSMSRDDLLELFHSYCVPFGQRKYRDSGRGKLLNKSRHMSPEHKTKLNVMDSSYHRRETPSRNIERLKPPPDILSGHMKRIKLDNTIAEENNVYKRKMSIDSMPPATDSPPPKKDRKTITWP